jgi:transposase InsO family protein
MTGLCQVEPRCSLVAHSCQKRQVFLTIVKNPSSYRRWPLHMQRFAFASPRFLLAAVVLLFLRFASAAELHVPSQHSTIQAAIDGAAGGDVVLVAPGIYSERIVLKADVTLRSVGDDAKGAIGLRRAEATIIDGGGDTKPEAGVEMAEAATLDGDFCIEALDTALSQSQPEIFNTDQGAQFTSVAARATWNGSRGPHAQ